MVSAQLAINKIGNISNVISGDATQGASIVQSAPKASFEQVLAQLSETMGHNLAVAESNSIDRMSSKTVGLTEAVNSIMAAERSLSTAIAIRDKMVQAYNEISRMQI